MGFGQLYSGVYLPLDCGAEWFPFLPSLLLVLIVIDIAIMFQIILLEPRESPVVSKQPS